MERIKSAAPKLCHTGIECLRYNSFFSELCRARIEWFRYNIFFSKAAVFISGLVFSHSFVEIAVVAVMMSCITDYLQEKNIRKAAAIVNLIEGVTAIMVIPIAHISDAYTGRFRMIVFTNASYTTGLALLWLTTRPFILNAKFQIFYVAVVLVALGKAAEKPPLRSFLADQLCEQEKNPHIDAERVEARTRIWWCVAWFLGATMALSFLTIPTWIETFKILAIVTGCAYLLFLPGIAFYYCKTPTGSPLTSIFRVIKTAILNRHLNYPPIVTNQLRLLPHIPFFRWLDKAAIAVESSTLSPEEQELCTITEVKVVKRLLKMVPIWTTFLVFSLVGATGSTFFIEQSKNLNSPIGNDPSNVLIELMALKLFSSFIVSYLYELLIPKQLNEEKRRHATRLRIVLGMAFSVLSCIAAWLVEIHRLKLINKMKLQDDQKTTIPMSVFWLVPEFVLWGVMEGLAVEGLDEFFKDQVGESMASYGPSVNECVLGIGKFVTIPLVFLFRGLWFGDTINKSHLDKYYITLALLSLVNIPLFWFVFTFYASKEAQEEEVELEAMMVDDIPVSGAEFLFTETNSYSRSVTWPFRMVSLYRKLPKGSEDEP